MDIAGVVLGAIPLVIEGIKFYGDVGEVATKKGFLRKLRTLSIALEAENAILRKTYDAILHDIRATEGAAMDLEKWKEDGILRLKVEERLGSSADIFRRTAENMDFAIKEIMKKLRIDPNRKTEDTSYASRIKMAWKQPEYDELLACLRRSNDQLKELAREPVNLGSKVRRKGQIALIGLARGLLNNVYSALNASMSCPCAERHGVNLQLESYPSSLHRHGDDDEAIDGMLIHAVLSFDSTGVHSPDATWHWEEIGIQRSQHKSSQTKGPTSIQLTKPRRLQKKETPSKSVADVMAGMANLGAAIGKPSDGTVLVDLCQRLGNAQRQNPQADHGYLLNNAAPSDIRLKVSSLTGAQCSGWTSISLKDVLQHHEEGGSIPHPGFKHKARLAPLLARGVLQLCSSPWLQENLTSDRIIFIQRASTPSLYETAYLVHCLPPTSGASGSGHYTTRGFDLPPYFTPLQERFFTLGVLLPELVLGTTWDSIRASSAATSDLAVANECLTRVQSENENYYLAIRCCIRFQFVCDEDLDKGQFREEVYEKVVGLLDGNLYPSMH